MTCISPKEYISLDEVKALIDFDLDAGSMTWRLRPPSMFTYRGTYESWNKRCAGKPALDAKHSHGYRYGAFGVRRYFAHIVLWALANDRWPDDQIDHIDGNRSNNRRENLRDVSASENQRNQRLKSTNKSGVTGVHWNAKSGRWHVQIHNSGKTISLGSFSSLSDAAEARARANATFQYHPNHGGVRDPSL